MYSTDGSSASSAVALSAGDCGAAGELCASPLPLVAMLVASSLALVASSASSLGVPALHTAVIWYAGGSFWTPLVASSKTSRIRSDQKAMPCDVRTW